MISLGILCPAQAQIKAVAVDPALSYVQELVRAIERHSIYPKGSGGQTCLVLVSQSKAGEILSIQTKACASRKLKRAVEAAVMKASPLPLPADPALFNPRLELNFVVPDGK